MQIWFKLKYTAANNAIIGSIQFNLIEICNIITLLISIDIKRTVNAVIVANALGC